MSEKTKVGAVETSAQLFERYLNEPFSELPANDGGRNDARRLCFEDFGMPLEIVRHVWEAGRRAAALAASSNGEQGENNV